MSGIPAERLEPTRGLDWHETDCKLNGIAWLEHVVLRRPFLWVEDESVGPPEIAFLRLHGFANVHCCCNVTRDAGSLQRLHQRLVDELGGDEDAARSHAAA